MYAVVAFYYTWGVVWCGECCDDLAVWTEVVWRIMRCGVGLSYEDGGVCVVVYGVVF